MKKSKKEIMKRLYIELVKFQKEIIASGLKVCVVLEGRDAAGKDSLVKRIVKHLSPRETIVVALGKPSDRDTNSWYFQRYTSHLPASGELVIFNRSWYNRAGVERVMDFCTKKEYDSFFTDVELFEKMLVDAGIILLKYYLDISKEEQEKRLEDRRHDPLKQWKISPIDDKAQELWKEYSEARDKMLEDTNFAHAPWYIANAENKSDVHIAMITHLLKQVDYKDKDKKLLENGNGLIFPATPLNVKEHVYR